MHTLNEPERAAPVSFRSVPKPDFRLCQFYQQIGQFMQVLDQLPDASTVQRNPLGSVPLTELPMPF